MTKSTLAGTRKQAKKPSRSRSRNGGKEMRANEEAGERPSGNPADLSAKELIQEAIEKVQGALRKQAEPTKETVTNLVQLLKLHKDLVAEDDAPSEIKVIWQDPPYEPSND